MSIHYLQHKIAQIHCTTKDVLNKFWYLDWLADLRFHGKLLVTLKHELTLKIPPLGVDMVGEGAKCGLHAIYSSQNRRFPSPSRPSSTSAQLLFQTTSCHILI